MFMTVEECFNDGHAFAEVGVAPSLYARRISSNHHHDHQGNVK